MIVVQTVITADNTDVLSGTDLANIPADGVLTVFIASTQNDTLYTLTGPGNEPLTRSQRATLRTNGMPSLQDDLPLAQAVSQGGHYVLNVDVQTAATVGIIAIYQDISEVL